MAAEEVITATEANRSFSRVLRGVQEGRRYVVTSQGRAVARIVPAGDDEDARARARRELLARLKRQPVIDIGPWTREELYEDGR
jgi:prevent-host-death family protein